RASSSLSDHDARFSPAVLSKIRFKPRFDTSTRPLVWGDMGLLNDNGSGVPNLAKRFFRILQTTRASFGGAPLLSPISTAMINSIKNGDQPLPRVTQVSITGIASTEQPPLKDKSMCNKTAKDLWDALERHMLGSEYGEQDKKAAVLYEYKTFKAIEGELLLDIYIRYLQVINDLKKCGYSKDKCELNFKFLNNLQPKWKQYATMIRQNKNLMYINIDALYNILEQNQGDVNDAIGSKKKTAVVTSDPLALITEKTNVSRSKKKVVVSLNSEGSEADDFSELKKITALLAKAFNQRKINSKPTNNNLRTSSSSQSANKKQEFVKTDNKRVEKKDDEKKRDMSRVKCYNWKKEGHFAKDCKKEKFVKIRERNMNTCLLDYEIVT
nr:hypothetical protein [Tanacetum cinerariifolium]